MRLRPTWQFHRLKKGNIFMKTFLAVCHGQYMHATTAARVESKL